MRETDSECPKKPGRRAFLVRVLGFFTAAGVAAGYGVFASFAARFLYPARGRKRGWLYVAEESKLKKGASLAYRSPLGESITIARRAVTGNTEDFIALSSTCPHLGCQVHWENSKNRFFCPCHNGVFNPEGLATSGPPADAKQSLPRFPLKVEKGLLFIQVPLEGLSPEKITLRPKFGLTGR